MPTPSPCSSASGSTSIVEKLRNANDSSEHETEFDTEDGILLHTGRVKIHSPRIEKDSSREARTSPLSCGPNTEEKWDRNTRRLGMSGNFTSPPITYRRGTGYREPVQRSDSSTDTSSEGNSDTNPRDTNFVQRDDRRSQSNQHVSMKGQAYVEERPQTSALHCVAVKQQKPANTKNKKKKKKVGKQAGPKRRTGWEAISSKGSPQLELPDPIPEPSTKNTGNAWNQVIKKSVAKIAKQAEKDALERIEERERAYAAAKLVKNEASGRSVRDQAGLEVRIDTGGKHAARRHIPRSAIE